MQSDLDGGRPRPKRAGAALPARNMIMPRLVFAGAIGFMLCLVGVAVAGVVAPDAMAALSGRLMGIPLKQTRAITGDPGRFNPVAAVAEASAFAGPDAKLVSMLAEYVRADGTMDLKATYTPAPQTEYKFAIEVPRPDNAPPPGAGGANSGTWYQPVTIDAYQPGRSSHITVTSAKGRISYDLVNQGFTRAVSDPTTQPGGTIEENPTCDLAAFWRTAIQTRDAPADAVATIEYKANAYVFNIAGSGIRLSFDKNCNQTRP